MKKFILLIVIICTAVIVMAQELELIFSHQYHAEEVGASCTDCHPAEESTLASDNLLPDMDGCYNCHDSEQACTVCHKDPDNAIAYPRITDYIAKFSHEQHQGEKFSCEGCHGGVAQSADITEKHLPKMAQCVACHSKTSEKDYCDKCHATDENLVPADHRLAWRQEHGIEANSAERNCNICHDENTCLECHQGDNLDHIVHPLNYVNNHGIYARGDKENCYTCHEELSFCMDCHQQRMVTPRNHSTANWSNLQTGGAHARAARLDLDTCIACHSDAAADPVCIQCHDK